MSAFDDDDDWVGEPPEGRHSRERADPDFWRTLPWLRFAYAGMGVALIVLAVVILLSR